MRSDSRQITTHAAYPVRVGKVSLHHVARLPVVLLLGLFSLFAAVVLAAPWSQPASASVNDGPTLSFSKSEYTLQEGARLPNDMFILSEPLREPITAFIQSTPGTAGVADYWDSTFPLDFAAEQTTAGIWLEARRDQIMDGGETFTLRIFESPVAIGAISEATVTITDNPAENLVWVSSYRRHFKEGRSISVDLKIAYEYPERVEIPVKVEHGSTGVGDVTATMMMVGIGAGSNQSSLVIQTHDDSEPEQDETFTVSVMGVPDLSLKRHAASGTITFTILDNEPGIKLLDPFRGRHRQVAEGDRVQIEVALEQAQSTDVTATLESRAIGNADSSDVVVGQTTVTIPAGQTKASGYIRTNRDDQYEPTEWFQVALVDTSLPGKPIRSPRAVGVDILDLAYWACFESETSYANTSFLEWVPHTYPSGLNASDWSTSAWVPIKAYGHRPRAIYLSFAYNKNGEDTAQTFSRTHLNGYTILYDPQLTFEFRSSRNRQLLPTIVSSWAYRLDDTQTTSSQRFVPVAPGKFFTVTLNQAAGMIDPIDGAECITEHKVMFTDQKPTFAFSASKYAVWAGDDVVVPVELHSQNRRRTMQVKVGVTPTDVTAVGGQDYQAGPYTVSVPYRERVQTLRIPTTSDGDTTAESFSLTLTDTYSLPEPFDISPQGNTTTVEIWPAPHTWPVVSIATDQETITEGESVTFSVTMTPPPAEDVTVMVFLSEHREDRGSLPQALKGPLTVTIPAGGASPGRATVTTNATQSDGADVWRTIYARIIATDFHAGSRTYYRADETRLIVFVEDSATLD